MCSDDDAEQPSTDSSSWLSAPQIAVQAASPLTQSPASDNERAEEYSYEDHQGFTARNVDLETPSHAEDQELEREVDDATEFSVSEVREEESHSKTIDIEPPEEVDRKSEEEDDDATKLYGSEMPQETEVAVTRSDDVEEAAFAVDDDQPVPDDDEEEAMEGRLSTDTAEQIFISQQIEAMTASAGQRQPAETSFSTEEHPTLGSQVPERQALPADSLDSSVPSGTDVDRLQSPDRTPIGCTNHVFLLIFVLS